MAERVGEYRINREVPLPAKVGTIRTTKKPEVGRIVLVHGLHPGGVSVAPAIVTFAGVGGDACQVEVEVFGGPFHNYGDARKFLVFVYDPRTDGSKLDQPNGEPLWAEWMPYQHAQHEAQKRIEATMDRWKSYLKLGEYKPNPIFDSFIRDLAEKATAATGTSCTCPRCMETPEEMAERMQLDHVKLMGRRFTYTKFGEGVPVEQRRALEASALVARKNYGVKDDPNYFANSPCPPGQILVGSGPLNPGWPTPKSNPTPVGRSRPDDPASQVVGMKSGKPATESPNVVGLTADGTPLGRGPDGRFVIVDDPVANVASAPATKDNAKAAPEPTFTMDGFRSWMSSRFKAAGEEFRQWNALDFQKAAEEYALVVEDRKKDWYKAQDQVRFHFAPGMDVYMPPRFTDAVDPAGPTKAPLQLPVTSPDPSVQARVDVAKTLFENNIASKLGNTRPASLTWDNLSESDRANWIKIAGRMVSGVYADDFSFAEVDDDDDDDSDLE